MADPDAVAQGADVAAWVEGGRVRHPRVRVAGEEWLLKSYRRGGLVALLNPDRYWGAGRFLQELSIAAAAHKCGVPVPEPLAVVLKEAGPCGACRAWQVVRFEPGLVSLRDLLLSADPLSPAWRALFVAGGEAVRRLHDAQIDHADLNLANILARAASPNDQGALVAGTPAACAFIVDLDRARMRSSGTWNPHRNLMRLWRSTLKLVWAQRSSGSLAARLLPALRGFLRGYFGRDHAALDRLRTHIQAGRLSLALHALLWRLRGARRAA